MKEKLKGANIVRSFIQLLIHCIFSIVYVASYLLNILWLALIKEHLLPFQFHPSKFMELMLNTLQWSPFEMNFRWPSNEYSLTRLNEVG